jgi:hypothetical protein
VSGPFETEDEARADPRVRAVYAAMQASTEFRMQDGAARIITSACEQAGVQLGAYEARIVRWVAGFEPQSALVIAALVERAAAGPDGPRCGQCGALAESYPDPYGEAPRMLWRHVKAPAMGEAAGFLDADHEAIPATALDALNDHDKPEGTP